MTSSNMEVQHKFDGGYMGMTKTGAYCAKSILFPEFQDRLHREVRWVFANQIEKHTVRETILAGSQNDSRVKD
jgi:hypothetical protein